MSYLVARAACGCVQAATDININDTELGEMVLDWMRRNLKIEKVVDAPRLGLCALHTELKEKDAEIERLRVAFATGSRDWSSLMTEFEALLIAYVEAREQDSDDGDSDDDLAIMAWEKLKDFFRQHVGTNAQGVPQSIVDAYELYLKANDDDNVSMDEFRDARMALIAAVGDAVNAQAHGATDRARSSTLASSHTRE